MPPSSRSARIYRQSTRSQVLGATDNKLALRYLKSPTQSGIFKFDTFRLRCNDLKNTISDLMKNDVRLSYRAERVGALFDENVSSILAFFTFLVDERDRKPEDRIRHSFNNFNYLLEGIDLTPLRDKYKEAIDFFENNIYTPNKDGELRQRSSIIKIKNGFLISNERRRETADILSLSRAPLETIVQFLHEGGFVDAAEMNIYSIFSPEEELLSPYVDVMAACLEDMPVSIVNKRHFTKAISNYYDEDYTGAVSSAGLVAEEYLSQIYETLAREPVPRNLTLGQLSKKIGTISKSIESPGAIKTLTQVDVAQSIEQIKFSADEKYVKKVANNILRYVAATVKDLKADLNTTEKSDQSYVIFPRLIKMGLDDLITYRNAASHKSTESIDSLKALKSLASSFSIAIWWEAERKTVDADATKEEVYGNLIERAKNYDNT